MNFSEKNSQVEKSSTNGTNGTSLQDQMELIVAVVVDLEKETGMVEKAALENELKQKYNFSKVLTARLIWKLLHEGTIFEPRQGYYKKT
jgi:DNA replicative helicase MCM subunit Mcm2 (Cdc46/Mcm family)